MTSSFVLCRREPHASRTGTEDCVGVGGAVVCGCHLSCHRRFIGSGAFGHGDTMMMGLYATLGIFLLIAVRNPPAHCSLIAFAAWSSFAHAMVMSALGFEIASERTGFLVGSGVLVVIGVALIALAPGKQSGQRAAAEEQQKVGQSPSDP